MIWRIKFDAAGVSFVDIGLVSVIEGNLCVKKPNYTLNESGKSTWSTKNTKSTKKGKREKGEKVTFHCHCSFFWSSLRYNFGAPTQNDFDFILKFARTKAGNVSNTGVAIATSECFDLLYPASAGLQ